MIRRMEERDLAAVAELEKLCFSENWSYHILESGIHSPYDVYYVFEQEGKIRVIATCVSSRARERCSGSQCIRTAAGLVLAEK